MKTWEIYNKYGGKLVDTEDPSAGTNFGCTNGYKRKMYTLTAAQAKISDAIPTISDKYISAIKIFGMTSEPCDSTTSTLVHHDGTISIGFALDNKALGIDMTNKKAVWFTLLVNSTRHYHYLDGTEKTIKGGSSVACVISLSGATISNMNIPRAALPPECRYIHIAGENPRLIQEF